MGFDVEHPMKYLLLTFSLILTFAVSAQQAFDFQLGGAMVFNSIVEVDRLPDAPDVHMTEHGFDVMFLAETTFKERITGMVGMAIDADNQYHYVNTQLLGYIISKPKFKAGAGFGYRHLTYFGYLGSKWQRLEIEPQEAHATPPAQQRQFDMYALCLDFRYHLLPSLQVRFNSHVWGDANDVAVGLVYCFSKSGYEYSNIRKK